MIDKKRNKASKQNLIHLARIYKDEIIKSWICQNLERMADNRLRLVSLQKTLGN